MRIYCIFLYSLILIFFKRIVCRKKIIGSVLQRISPRTNIKLFDSARFELGRNIQIESMCDIQVHGTGILIIGARSYFNHFCMISCHNRIEIGANCMFGPGVRIFDNNHKFSRDHGVSAELNTAPVIIGKNCWIASNVIILKGVTIGDNCIIGAGCVITKNIPDNSIVRENHKLQIEELKK